MKQIDDVPRMVYGVRYLDETVDPAVYKWRWTAQGHYSDPASGNNVDKKGAPLDVDLTVAATDTETEILTQVLDALKTEAGVS